MRFTVRLRLSHRPAHPRSPYMALHTLVLKCDPASISFMSGSDVPQIADKDTEKAITTASHHLCDSLNTVVFPTETVYGLGALALNESAAAKIFSTKGRPPDNPLIVHVSSLSMLHKLLPPDYTISRAYQALIKSFWPGPLTLLFPRNLTLIPSIITAGQSTVAIRMPSHPVARALIAIANAPLAAPSANTSGKPSPTRADHVFRDLSGKVSIILDGGACGVGLESTVVDGLHEDGSIRVLRPGGVTVEEIEQVLQKELHDCEHIPQVLVHRRDYRDEAMEQAPTTPGMKYRHYSPSVPVHLICSRSKLIPGERSISFATFLEDVKLSISHSQKPLKFGVMAPEDSEMWNYITPADGITWIKFNLGRIAEPAVTAHRLFDGFLTLENALVDLIIIEEVDEEKEGLAVMNRVRKAAGSSTWINFD